MTIASRFPDKQTGEFSNNFIRRADTLALPVLAGSFWLQKKDSMIYQQGKYDYEEKKYSDFEIQNVVVID